MQNEVQNMADMGSDILAVRILWIPFLLRLEYWNSSNPIFDPINPILIPTNPILNPINPEKPD